MTTTTPPHRQFRIFVADNFRYQDPDAEYEIEGADTAEGAIDKCREIVDQSLAQMVEPGSSAKDIVFRYRMFGVDPYILPPRDERTTFSAWDYADERAASFVRPAEPDPSPAAIAGDDPTEKRA